MKTESDKHMKRHHLMRVILAVLLAASLSGGILGCSTGRHAFNTGLELEEGGRIEEALYRYAEAMKLLPEEGEFRVRFLSARDKAARQRYSTGQNLLQSGKYAEALVEFQTAWGLDASQELYRQKMEIAGKLRDSREFLAEGRTFESQNKLKEAERLFIKSVELDASCIPCREAVVRLEDKRKSRLAGFEMALKSSKPITLKFRDARLKQIFAVITQLSGINFIFDEAVKDQNITLSLENATFQQSLDLLTGMFKLGRKTLNESTIIIYAKTPDKIKQYEDMVVRTFHLDHLDAKKAVALVRTLMQVRKIHVNEDANAVVVRDTAEVTDVVEKILEAHDLPGAEVVLDVEVIEISNKNAQNVGLLLSNYNVQLGGFSPQGNLLSTSLQNSTSTSTTSAATDSLVRAFSVGKFGGYVTVPNAQYNFGKTLANGEVLSNPKIRVKNKEKAKFNVGTRVPITTTTIATTGTTSQVNVQYVDVGVKVNAEPTIQLNDEISIKISLEVSSIVSRETVGGADSATTVVTIGTRNLDTVLSLKDGETSVIGGLIANSKSESKQKVFLLGDLPLIGPLLSSNETSKDKTELILAITPRLVRGVSIPKQDLLLIRTGREDDPSLVQTNASFVQEPLYAPTDKPLQARGTAIPVPAPAVPSPAAAGIPAGEQNSSLPQPAKTADSQAERDEPPPAVPSDSKEPAQQNVAEQFETDAARGDAPNSSRGDERDR
jgi:general secretion pathway protein D